MRVDSLLTIGTEELSRADWRRLFTTLTFVDENEVECQAYDVRNNGQTVAIPRGAWNLIDPSVSVTDLRSCPPMPKVRYAKELDALGYEGQKDALLAMYANEQGQVIAPPGRGKTEIGLAFAASCKTRTLVIVHTKDLFKQWTERAATSVPGMKVGKISGKVCQVEHLTIAMAQTLKRYVVADGRFWRQFGCLIVDEAHHSAAETWEWILNACPAKYRFGLTATDKRADGRQPLVKFYVGPVIYRIKFHSQVPITVQPVRTGFGYQRVVYRGPYDWTKMLRLLGNDEQRNAYIADRVKGEMDEGHLILVLTRHIKHLENIAVALGPYCTEDEFRRVRVITGRMAQGKRDELIQDFRDGRVQVLLATQLADEGLDVPRLDRVHLTFPGKHDGRIIQQIGRAIRKYPKKENAIITDYVDDLVPPLARQYVERKRTYKTLGIHIEKAVGYGSEKKEGRKLRGALLSVRRSRGA